MTEQIDYSERAIARRLERLSQLRELCVSLSKARRRPTPSTPQRHTGADPIRENAEPRSGG